MKEVMTGFHTPILIVEDYPDCEAIADRFTKLAKAKKKEDSKGGLLSAAWNEHESASSNEDYDQYGYTSFYTFNLVEDSDFEEIHSAAIKVMESYLYKLDRLQSFFIDNSWASIYGNGHYVPPHVHPQSHLSMVFYGAATEGTGEIVFENPAQESSRMFYVGRQQLTMRRLNIQPKKGLFIVFPSFISHYTKPHLDSEERVIFSCNAIFNGR